MKTGSDISQIYNDNHRVIYNLAFKMTGSREDAEDILQETFTTVYQKIDQFKAESSTSTWIYSIAKNISLRFLENRQKKSFDVIAELAKKYQQKPAPLNYSEAEKSFYINQVKDGCLQALLICLKPTQRIAFILYTLLEVPVKNVALIMNKSEAACRVLVCRARQNLKDFLCKNCSLYDNKNHCKCENLIDFSLKHNLIEKMYPAKKEKTDCFKPEAIEAEIKNIKHIAILYKTISEPELSEQIDQKIKDILKQNPLTNFSA